MKIEARKFNRQVAEEIHMAIANKRSNSGTAVNEVEEIVRGAKLLGELQQFFARFVDLQPRQIYVLLPLWVIATHMYEKFEYMGYLCIFSPEPRCGKSILLSLLRAFAYKSHPLIVSPTPAVLFRTALDSTQLLDEVDAWTNKDDLRSVLNAGFQKGGEVLRMREMRGDYSGVRFPVYCPRALAGIGESFLDRATRDRCFMIRMERQKSSERREPFRPGKLEKEIATLKARIEKWAKENAELVADMYEAQCFPYLEAFNDRTIDIAQPLAAILEVCAATEEEFEQTRKVFCEAIASTRDEQQAPNKAQIILRALQTLAELQEPLVGSATELAERLSASGEEITKVEVSATLRQYGWRPKSVRLDGGEPRSRYSLGRAEIAERVERYASEPE